jgi:hypothetical protein
MSYIMANRKVFIESDYIGKLYGQLTITEFTPVKRVSNGTQFSRKCLCRCSCGKSKEFYLNNILNGSTKSCGCRHCYRKDANPHRLTRLFKIYMGMKSRCYNKNNNAFKHYGGRGITICEEWLNSFDSFHKWAMSNGYSDKLSIDRINVNGNYEPQNCRWATQKQQANNKRTSGKMTMTELAKLTGYSVTRVSQLLFSGKTPLREYVVGQEGRRLIFGEDAVKYLRLRKEGKIPFERKKTRTRKKLPAYLRVKPHTHIKSYCRNYLDKLKTVTV